MKNTILFLGFLLFSLSLGNAQGKITVRYIGYKYEQTKNNSFVNKKLIFATMDNDSLYINVKLPYNPVKHNVVDYGIYYNCHLKQDSIYTIEMKKISVNDIPDCQDSYYKSNAIFNDNNRSEFIEIEKNTKYLYKGYYGKFVDIENVLYEIIGLKPDNDCFYP